MKQFLRKLIIDKTENIWMQFFRYTFVGGSAFVVDLGLLYLLTDKIGIYYLVSVTISFTIGLIVNYALSKIFVFKHSVVKNRTAEFVFFALIGIAGLGITDLFMWLLVDLKNINYIISKVITTFFVYLWNFFARKYILFNSIDN